MVSTSLWACTADTTQQSAEIEAFFDLQQYFTAQAAQLDGQQNVQKKTSIDGKEEQRQVSNLNFEDELQLFINSAINRPAWLDKYQVDSTTNATGQLTRLTYRALEDQLRTRQVDIRFDNTTVTAVHILNETDNAIAQTKQELTYEAAKGYTIKSFQDVLMSEPHRMTIEVSF